MPKRGPRCKIGYFNVFNHMMNVLYTGMKWKELPIEKDENGNPEVHSTVIFKKYGTWPDDGSALSPLMTDQVLVFTKGSAKPSCRHKNSSRSHEEAKELKKLQNHTACRLTPTMKPGINKHIIMTFDFEASFFPSGGQLLKSGANRVLNFDWQP